MTKNGKTRVALIGASCRAIYSFAPAILKTYRDRHELVGMYDVSARRMRVFNESVEQSIPAYEDVDRMFAETKPDLAIITTIDATHVDYLERSLAHGVNCICEKPLCIDAEQCRRVRRAQAAYPRVMALTAHNFRYAPACVTVKRLLDSGAIGTVRALTYQELLDQRHGSSYFRRWNRQKRVSGGLLIHKASHCFDLMNWWVGSRPASLTARGSLTAYGPKASPFHGERCCDCPHAAKCPQYVDLSDGFRGELYFKAREPGSYTPDLCVFSPEIDIEDHAAVGYVYENGVEVTFDLCAYSAYEGILISIEGTQGRIEYIHRMNTGALAKTAEHGTEETTGESLRLYRFEKPTEAVPIDIVDGGHGGADTLIMKELFGGGAPGGARATIEDGIQAVLIGAAANVSMATGRSVDVQSLLA